MAVPPEPSNDHAAAREFSAPMAMPPSPIIMSPAVVPAGAALDIDTLSMCGLTHHRAGNHRHRSSGSKGRIANERTHGSSLCVLWPINAQICLVVPITYVGF